METNKSEVVILGGGVMGFSIAYNLAKQGISCQVIEMDSIAAKASGRNEGGVSSPALLGIFFATPFSSPYALEPCAKIFDETFFGQQQLVKELQKSTGIDIEFADTPCLIPAFGEEDEKAIKEQISLAQSKVGESKGYEARWIDLDELRSLYPYISSDIRGAALAGMWQLEPYKYVLSLAQAAEALGTSIKIAEAVGFHTRGKMVTSVTLSNGREVNADKVVIAMGPWSGIAASWLGVKIPLKAIKAQALKLQSSLDLPMYAIAWGESSGNGPFIHRTVPGPILAGYHEERPETWDDSHPETWDDRPTEEVRDWCIAGLLRGIPAADAAMLIEARCGILGYASDSLPVFGSLPRWENVYIGAGLGTVGNSLSPAASRLISDLILEGARAEKAKEQLNAVSPSRFC
jgi:glycine/D-amino acid oxidase-like deaminating enzyme